MNTPAISICLPNLNSARFIPERIQSIRDQTAGDYEVVICDNYSDDGAYELLGSYAAEDPRVRLQQMPREGMYANWNNCVRLARAEWIYIATSDDTMKPRCLARMLEAGRKSDSDIVTSPSWVLDEAGRELPSRGTRTERWILARPDGEGWLNPAREALVGLLFGTPTTSITQMLIRRRVFDEVGVFPTLYGSMGDFFWQMAALRRCRWYYLDEALGAWRVHGSQATPGEASKIYAGRARMVCDLHAQGHLQEGLFMQVAAGFAVGLVDGVDVSGMPGPVKLVAGMLRRLRPARRPQARYALGWLLGGLIRPAPLRGR